MITLTNSIHGAGWIECVSVLCVFAIDTQFVSEPEQVTVFFLQIRFCADAMKTALLTKCGKNKHYLHFLIDFPMYTCTCVKCAYI